MVPPDVDPLPLPLGAVPVPWRGENGPNRPFENGDRALAAADPVLSVAVTWPTAKPAPPMTGDAGGYEGLDLFAHIYMFNPFPSTVMQEVLTNLGSSLARAPRDVTLVYGNPVWHETIMASGLFTLERQVPGRGISQYSVYTHKAFRNRGPWVVPSRTDVG